MLAASLLLVAALHAAQNPRDTTPEPVVIELRLARITGATVLGYRVRSEVLLPLSQFFRLAEIRYHLAPDGRLEATLDGNRRLVIDSRSDSMRDGARAAHIDAEVNRYEAAGLY